MQRAAGANRPRAGVLCMTCAIAGVLLSAGASSVSEEPPREWIDRATGHRIVRLSDLRAWPASTSIRIRTRPAGDKMVVVVAQEVCGRSISQRW